jgi:hypothetical protein
MTNQHHQLQPYFRKINQVWATNDPDLVMLGLAELGQIRDWIAHDHMRKTDNPENGFFLIEEEMEEAGWRNMEFMRMSEKRFKPEIQGKPETAYVHRCDQHGNEM